MGSLIEIINIALYNMSKGPSPQHAL